MENTDKPARRRSPKPKPGAATAPPMPGSEPLPDLLAGLPAADEPATPPAAKPPRKRAPARKAATPAPPPAEATSSSGTAATSQASVPPATTMSAAIADKPASPAPPKSRPPATGRATRSTLPAKATAAKSSASPLSPATQAGATAPGVEVQDALPLPEAPPWSSEAQASVPVRSAAPIARPADASTRSMRVIEAVLRVLPERHRARWRDYLVLMRMDRPVGALLLLWPTWWALWFAANGMPSLKLFAIFTAGVFVMRAAGCVINDYADHDWLDANVERTRGRPMAAGRVSRREALLLFGGLLLIAFGLVLMTDPLTIALSFAGAALAAIYPFAKRVTHLAQVVLGAAFGWSIPMAFAATLGEVPALGWLLFLANVLFSVIYDTQYAMVDRDEDIRIGARSTAILFGDADRAILGVLMLSFVITLLLAGSRAALAWPWTAGVAVVAILFGWQQSLIRDRDRAGCFAAFRNNNWVGFVIWLGLVAALALPGAEGAVRH